MSIEKKIVERLLKTAAGIKETADPTLTGANPGSLNSASPGKTVEKRYQVDKSSRHAPGKMTQPEKLAELLPKNFVLGFVEKCASLGITGEKDIMDLLYHGLRKQANEVAPEIAEVSGKDAVNDIAAYYEKAKKAPMSVKK